MNHSISRIAVLFCFAILSQAAIAQNAIMSLEQAVDYATQNSPEIRDAVLKVQDAEAQIVENRSRGLPQINGSVNYQRYLKVPQQPLPEVFQMPGAPESISFVLKNNLVAAANLETMVFDGVYFVALKAAKAARSYAQAELVSREKSLKKQVRQAYLPLLLVKSNLDQLDKNISNLEVLHKETEAIFNEGFAEQLDVDRLALSLANLKTEREGLSRQYGIALRALKFTINYPLDNELEIEDDIEQILADAEALDVNAQGNALTSYPELKLMDEYLNLQDLNLRAQRTAYLPSLNAFATYQEQYQGDKLQDGFWAPTAFVGLNLRLPIYDGGFKKSQMQRVRIAIEQGVNQRQTIERSIDLEIKNARDAYSNALERLDDREQSLDLAQRIYDTTQIKYREGIGSSLEVNQAEQALYSAQTNRLQALYELLNAKISLQEALGLL